jgi:hypothetical protein
MPCSIVRPPTEDSKRFRLSGVVIRTSGGCCCMRRLSVAEVSPLRVMTLGSCHGIPSTEYCERSSASGESRLRWMSLFSAFSGDTYRTYVQPDGQRPVTIGQVATEMPPSSFRCRLGRILERGAPWQLKAKLRLELGLGRRIVRQTKIVCWCGIRSSGSLVKRIGHVL